MLFSLTFVAIPMEVKYLQYFLKDNQALSLKFETILKLEN